MELLRILTQNRHLVSKRILCHSHRPLVQKQRQQLRTRPAENPHGCRRSFRGAFQIGNRLADRLKLLQSAHLIERLHIQVQEVERLSRPLAFLIHTSQRLLHLVDRGSHRLGTHPGRFECLRQQRQFFHARTRPHGKHFQLSAHLKRLTQHLDILLHRHRHARKFKEVNHTLLHLLVHLFHRLSGGVHPLVKSRIVGRNGVVDSWHGIIE